MAPIINVSWYLTIFIAVTSTVCVNTLQSGRGSRLGSARSGRGTDDSDDESARKQSGFSELDLECPPNSVLPRLPLICFY